MSDLPAVPNVSLGTFADYVNVAGPARIQCIANQREWHLDPSSSAPRGYGPAFSSISRAVSREDSSLVRQMIFQAGPTMRSHYEEIARGMEAWLLRTRPKPLETRKSTCSYGELRVNVHRHFGVNIEGVPHIVFPYLKAPVLTLDGAKVIWRTLEHVQDEVLPGSKILVLDVRRLIDQPHRHIFKPTSKQRDQLDAWIYGEAAGYVAHWRRAAA